MGDYVPAGEKAIRADLDRARRDALSFAAAALHDASSDLYCAGEEEMSEAVRELARRAERKLEEAEAEHQEHLREGR